MIWLTFAMNLPVINYLNEEEKIKTMSIWIFIFFCFAKIIKGQINIYLGVREYKKFGRFDL